MEGAWVPNGTEEPTRSLTSRLHLYEEKTCCSNHPANDRSKVWRWNCSYAYQKQQFMIMKRLSNRRFDVQCGHTSTHNSYMLANNFFFWVHRIYSLTFQLGWFPSKLFMINNMYSFVCTLCLLFSDEGSVWNQNKPQSLNIHVTSGGRNCNFRTEDLLKREQQNLVKEILQLKKNTDQFIE